LEPHSQKIKNTPAIHGRNIITGRIFKKYNPNSRTTAALAMSLASVLLFILIVT